MCPRIFHIYGPLWVNGYGLMIALGFLLFACLTYRHAWRKQLLSGEKYLNVLFLGFLSAIVGGRLLFVLFNLSSFDHIAEIFYPWVGGFSLFGSIIFVLFAVPWYLRKHDIAILPFFDLLALYAPLLLAISRIGCFLAGCCHGVPTSVWWGVHVGGQVIHATQLYASFFSLCTFIILYIVSKKAYVRPGIIITLFLCLISLSRFMIDFWRGDQEWIGTFGGIRLSSMQLIVAPIFVASCVALYLLIRRKRTDGGGV